MIYGDKEYIFTHELGHVGYRLKRDEIVLKMEEVLQDALLLAQLCAADYNESNEYRKLLRMIEDQSKEVCGERVLKENKEILPTSMQNPSDEDATYREKSGVGHVGYVVNLVECCSENGHIVTDYDLQANTYSDIDFAKDILNNPENVSEVIITDGAFGSAANLELAEEKGITLAATTLCGGVTDDFEAQFEIEETTNTIIHCQPEMSLLTANIAMKKVTELTLTNKLAKVVHIVIVVQAYSKKDRTYQVF